MKEKTNIIILNKPIDYSIIDARELLEEQQSTHTHSISDLNSNSEGLVVFVTDSYSTQSEVYENEYEVTIDDYLSKAAENILTKGMNIDEENYSGITLIEEKHKGKRSVVRVSSTKANDIKIKKMFEAIGYRVVSIRRIRIGKFKLGVLSIGRWKYVNDTDSL